MWIREVTLTGMQLDSHQRRNQAGLQQHLLDGIDLLQARIAKEAEPSYAKDSVKNIDHIPWSMRYAAQLWILPTLIDAGRGCVRSHLALEDEAR
jgi:hypothetical protein